MIPFNPLVSFQFVWLSSEYSMSLSSVPDAIAAAQHHHIFWFFGSDMASGGDQFSGQNDNDSEELNDWTAIHKQKLRITPGTMIWTNQTTDGYEKVCGYKPPLSPASPSPDTRFPQTFCLERKPFVFLYDRIS